MADRKKKFNRIKIVLIENDKSNKWLAEKMQTTPTTVSRWCTNDAQPPLESLFQIAELLNVDVSDLLNKSITLRDR